MREIPTHEKKKASMNNESMDQLETSPRRRSIANFKKSTGTRLL